MTLRYDNHRRPIGLDWSVCNDGNPRPEVWDPSYLQNLLLKRRKKHPFTINPGSGRGANMILSDEIQNQICEMYSKDKKNAYEIARHFSITPKTVYRTLRRNDVPTRTKTQAMILRHETERASA